MELAWIPLSIVWVAIAWVPISMLGGLMQAVRTAAQKQLNAELSTWATTYVRSLFGIPVLTAYLLAVIGLGDRTWPDFSAIYIFHSLGAAFCQVVATYFLIQLFALRNFAVGTMLAKTDLMQAAVIGSLFFSEVISPIGWIAILLTVFGVVAMAKAKSGGAPSGLAAWSGMRALFSPSVRIGLAAGFLFCLSYLFLREATLAISGTAVFRGAWTVVMVTGSQALLLGLILGITHRSEFPRMVSLWRPCSFIGLTSALGSLCWFTAMAMQNASYVRAVGQVEVIFTWWISVRYFGETIARLELVGIATILAGVLLLIL